MAEPAVGSDVWIRNFHPAPSADLRLVCFPHMGGSAGFFLPVSAGLRPEVEVLAVQYPGRQDRLKEEPATDVHTLADGVVAALRPWSGEPLAFFGHSMGALVAFEVCRRLEREGIEPVMLVASGMWAPSRRHLGKLPVVDQQDVEGTLRGLKHLNGTDPEILEGDEDLLEMILPVLRADYTATLAYQSPPEAELSCPVTAFVGDRDPLVPLEAVQAWREHTTGGFELQVFGGDHFYLNALRTATISRLSEVLRASV